MDILLLRSERQGQVMAHHPGHQPGIETAQAVLAAELLSLVAAQFGMVAAAALADVVIQAGDVQQFRAWADAP